MMQNKLSAWRHNDDRRNNAYIAGLAGLLCAAILSAVSFGAIDINIFSGLSPLQHAVLFDVRLPRVVMTAITGAGLAVCGLVLQALTRNPLAEPNLIGVSASAALFASMAILLSSTTDVFEQWLGIFWIPSMAFIGALLSLFLLLSIAGYRQSINNLVLILAGVAINAGAGTLLGLMLYLADDETLRLITFWQLGSYAGIAWKHVLLTSIVIGFALVFFATKTKTIMLLQLGEQQAQYQGVNVTSFKRTLLIFVALVTAVCVCFTGIIGFVGLVIPHLCRMLMGERLVVLLPASAIAGAVLVTIADVVARLIVLPAELPIGLLTSALGVPFFLFLILREKRKFSYD